MIGSPAFGYYFFIALNDLILHRAVSTSGNMELVLSVEFAANSVLSLIELLEQAANININA